MYAQHQLCLHYMAGVQGATDLDRQPVMYLTCLYRKQGTIEYAKYQVEHYRSQLEHRVLSRFDKAEAKKDTVDMSACAAVMREMENSQSSSALVQAGF